VVVHGDCPSPCRGVPTTSCCARLSRALPPSLRKKALAAVDGFGFFCGGGGCQAPRCGGKNRRVWKCGLFGAITGDSGSRMPPPPPPTPALKEEKSFQTLIPRSSPAPPGWIGWLSGRGGWRMLSRAPTSGESGKRGPNSLPTPRLVPWPTLPLRCDAAAVANPASPSASFYPALAGSISTSKTTTTTTLPGSSSPGARSARWDAKAELGEAASISSGEGAEDEDEELSNDSVGVPNHQSAESTRHRPFLNVIKLSFLPKLRGKKDLPDLASLQFGFQSTAFGDFSDRWISLSLSFLSLSSPFSAPLLIYICIYI
ncbi:hypothetical protein JRQ81_016296, partial [Phrynocephalus forsythii]